MHFIQRILVLREHAHVWTELFDKCVDDITGGCSAGNSNTLCDDIGAITTLEVEAHHSMELQIL